MNWVVSNAGSIATPHSQRSYAYLKLSLEKGYFPDFVSLISQFEDVIGTPVQTAVKRQDEQAFARLNAENLMFCEDAARRIKNDLERQSFITDYWFKVEHQESLHAHNAVVIDQKF
jgi:GTP cyclohydrolase I